jgi:serine/threonine protein kinase/tetratricopeptide (TPR) repeat protein
LFAKKQIPHQLVMTSARWQAILKIFEDALEKPQGDRDEFVREACAGDPDIEAEVARLLTADEDAGSFLEGPIVSTLPPRSTLNRKPTVLASGSLVSGRFEVVRFIGQGGMGQVYEALDLELKGKVALKAIREDISSDPQMLARFRREVLLTRRITHPNVCRTFDIERHSSIAADGTNSDITFLTMELLEGETLADLLRRQGRLATPEALPLVLQMIEALSAAHSVGIVHRDFKPSNVLLVPINNGLRVVVTDFGLARAILPDSELSGAATSLTGSQGLMGTLVYMAPEQFERGEATVASDTYSLGLVMYEMVTGQRPFADAMPFAEAAKRIKQPAPSPKMLVPELDFGWEAAICRCLQLRPEDRFEDVHQVAASITNVSQNLSSRRTFPSQGSRRSPEIATGVSPSRSGSWRRGTVAIAILVFVVSLSGVLFRYYRVRVNAKLAEGSTVLLTEIKNITGDKRFDGTTELVRHQLTQSPYFNLMDGGRVRDLLTQMTKASNSQLDPPIAREVALRGGAPRVIFGAVSRVGDSYVLDMDIEQPDNDPRRSRAQWEKHWTWNMSAGSSDAAIPSGFLGAVREAGDWIRSEVGESANDIARVDAPPQDVTTGNWDALSEFAEAEQFKAGNQDDSAVVALKNAVAVDPHFALAYARLGDVLVSMSRYDEAYAAYRRALAQQQLQRLTRREKDRLEGIYALDTEDFKTAETAFHDYTVYYPNDYLGWFYRASPLMMMGRVQEAITTLKKAVAIDPTRSSAPAHIARYDLILGDFGDAERWIQHLRQTGHRDDASIIEGQLEFLQSHYEEALTSFASLHESTISLYRSDSYSLQARVFAELGQYKNALEALQKGITADLETGDSVHRSDKLLDRAYINFKQGKYEACMQDTENALELDRSLQRSLTAGTILGSAASQTNGRLKSQLTSELRKIEVRLPRVSFVPISDIVQTHLHGEILLSAGDWKSALDEFRKADRLEAPAKDKGYMARGLMAAARHASEAARSQQFKEGAKAAYASLALRPGQVWEWPQDYLPGVQSDEVFEYARLANELKHTDARAISLLSEYVGRRAHADAGLIDVGDAKRMLEAIQTK